MKELYFKTLEVLCYDSFQRALILGVFSFGTLVIEIKAIFYIAPKSSIKEAIFGPDGVLQRNEGLELFKMVIASISFSVLVGVASLDVIKGIEARWPIMIYVVFTLICTFSIYELDKNKLVDIFKRIKP